MFNFPKSAAFYIFRQVTLQPCVVSTMRCGVSRRYFCSWQCENNVHSHCYVHIFKAAKSKKNSDKISGAPHKYVWHDTDLFSVF